MPHDARLALKRARRTGAVVCLASVALAAVFLYGLARGSYWALAAPVTVAVLGVLSLAFWIGHTIRTVRGVPAEADHYEGRTARLIALGICIVSVGLAAVFLAGVAQRSYWALALPVGAAVLGLTGMVFWIGWAIVVQRSTLPDAQPGADAPPPEAPPQSPPAANPADPAP